VFQIWIQAKLVLLLFDPEANETNGAKKIGNNYEITVLKVLTLWLESDPVNWETLETHSKTFFVQNKFGLENLIHTI